MNWDLTKLYKGFEDPAFIADTWLHPILWPFVVYALCVAVHAAGRKIPVLKHLFP